jgi:hypothetical protein
MTDLSTAAQAVMNACTDRPIHIDWATKSAAAAALRAAADQLTPYTVSEMEGAAFARNKLLAIADELEDIKYGTYRCNISDRK